MRWVRLGIVVSALAAALASAALGQAERRLVLVTGAQSPVAPITLRELRRIYLGAALQQDGVRLHALRNRTDPLLHEVFLQKVLFMSARSYERRLLSLALQRGTPRPPQHETETRLLAALRDTPGAVTYMWASAARRVPEVQIVQTLWVGSTD